MCVKYIYIYWGGGGGGVRASVCLNIDSLKFNFYMKQDLHGCQFASFQVENDDQQNDDENGYTGSNHGDSRLHLVCKGK